MTPTSQNIAILVSVLFAIAALTDFFDDVTGGAENSVYRKFGWFDDIADTVLMVGTLLAMAYVLSSPTGPNQYNGGAPTLFLAPVGIIILLASPWLSPWMTSIFSKGGDIPKGPVDLSDPAISDPSVFDAYSKTWEMVWNTGLVILWIGAILSVITGLALLTGKNSAANDG